MENTRGYNNFTMILALQEVDEKLAIEAISDINLNTEELSEILTISLMGSVINKETKIPCKLNNKVCMAGILNKMKQLERDNK